MRLKTLILTYFTVLLCAQTNIVTAAQTGDTLSITFTGRLNNHKPCVVNNNQDINVAFGNVNIARVSTDHITHAMDYSLDCSGTQASNTVEMTIKAIPVTGDTAAIASNIPGLWLRFIKDGKPQDLNASFIVTDWQSPPRLEIELEKDPAVELQAAEFSGTATLISEYF